MGTSVNQPSPKTTSWRAVTTCYESDQISPDRAAAEIWHAATTDSTIEAQVKSDAVFACYQLSQKGISSERVHAALASISSEFGNSMVLEYAKRATAIAAQGRHPGQHWPALFFKQLTNYFVSRDASGFV